MHARANERELLAWAARRAVDEVEAAADRPAGVDPEALAGLARFDEALTDAGRPGRETIELLLEAGGPATMSSTGADYFGFVNGGTLPAALAAAFVTSAWDQNAALPAMSPVADRLHRVARGWVVEVLGLPAATELALVTGATMANASCLAAARDTLCADVGWDVQRQGLFGAPPIEVVVGERVHTTVAKSLGFVGLGRDRVTTVPADDQGRMRADGLSTLDLGAGPVIVCAQAGEVNSGAFDPFAAIVDWCRDRSAAGRPTWLHVDGAFGLWALADPTRSHLVDGLADADSWATDGHKWLNVTYDCGLTLVARPGALRRTFQATAAYLPPSGREGQPVQRSPSESLNEAPFEAPSDAPFEAPYEAMHHTPQSSQRARQIEVWAALRTLGRNGLARLIQQACDSAGAMADDLAAAGFEVLNDVVLNQILVRCHDGATTEALIDAIQDDGRVWCGPTIWHGETAMRISVSSWRTTPESARRSASVIAEIAAALDSRPD